VPRPIAELKGPFALTGILCDIDDTLTWEGRLIPAALLALHRAQQAGLRVVPITGRPAGWVDHIARMWPVDGVVGENGGLWFWMQDGKLYRRFSQSAEERRSNRARLDAIAKDILKQVPGTALASDQPYRELDLAIDFCEDVPALPDQDIDRIVSAFSQFGATCKVSSIHVNGWYGAFDKLDGFKRFHQDRFGSEVDFSAWAFFGDSANDEPMFGAFGLGVGVANVARFLPRMTHHPNWITTRPGGMGFVEGIERILAERS
jgi:HAD superfamily hydrolase (TIGR01484 family)